MVETASLFDLNQNIPTLSEFPNISIPFNDQDNKFNLFGWETQVTNILVSRIKYDYISFLLFITNFYQLVLLLNGMILICNILVTLLFLLEILKEILLFICLIYCLHDL